MEVLERVGTPEQKEQWLKPLLAGRSAVAFAMTEPDVASVDAKNVATAACETAMSTSSTARSSTSPEPVTLAARS